MSFKCHVIYSIIKEEVIKMQESRIFKIVYYLLEKGHSTAPELSEKFEVSIRTIYRDIDVISSAGIPIYATQGKGGGIFIQDNFTLDKSMFSKTEREQILAGMQAMMATEGKNTDALLTKLNALFQVQAANWIEVDFSNWMHNKPQQDVFNIIKEAIFNKRVLSFTYFNSSGKANKRSIKPCKLIFKSKDWYVYGFCLLKNEFRLFKLTRIKKLEILLDTFSIENIPPIIKTPMPEEKTCQVKLKFNKHIAFRVYDEFSDAISEDEEGNLYVQTSLPDNEVIYSYLLSFGDSVEILAPQRMRIGMKKKIDKLQEKYRT